MYSLRTSSLARHGGVLALYLVLSILMTWPLILRLTTHVAGHQADNQLFVWTLWVLKHQLSEGLTPLFTNAIYYPDGISLAIHTWAWTKSVPGLLLQTMMSADTTYNLLILASLTLNGYTMWLLVKYLTADDVAAFIGGAIYAFSPIVLAHAVAGHLNLTGVEGLPLFVLFLLNALNTLRIRYAVFAGLAAAYTLLTDWTLGLFAVLFVVVMFVVCLFAERRQHLRWPVIRQYTVIGIIAVIAAGPILIPTLSASGSGEYDMTHYIGGAALYVSDVFGFITPSPDHFLVGDAIRPIFDRFTGGPVEGTVFIGFTVLVLVIVGLWKTPWSKTRLWVVVFLVFTLISLGPGLHVLGVYRFPWLAWLPMGTIAQNLGVPMRPEWVQMFDEAPMIPLPGALLQLMPLFKWTRAFSRYFIVSMLALSVLASYGTTYLRSLPRIRLAWGGGGAGWLSVLLGALILFEFNIAPFPTAQMSTPVALMQATSDGDEYGLLHLPIRRYQLEPQYWQTHHGKSLLYGHISRVPEERFGYLDFVEQEVYNPQSFFADADIRYLVLNKAQLSNLPSDEGDALVAALETQYELAVEDDDLRIYYAYDLESE